MTRWTESWWTRWERKTGVVVPAVLRVKGPKNIPGSRRGGRNPNLDADSVVRPLGARRAA